MEKKGATVSPRSSDPRGSLLLSVLTGLVVSVCATGEGWTQAHSGLWVFSGILECPDAESLNSALMVRNGLSSSPQKRM